MNVNPIIFLSVGLVSCSSTTNGRYVGDLSVEQGSCSSQPANAGHIAATLVLRGDKAEFAPDDGVAVLTGQIDSAGHLLVSSNAPGADHKPFREVFEGDRTGDKIRGKFATPLCRATVELSRR